MLYLLKKYYPVRKVLFVLGEGLLIFLSINLVYILFSGWEIYRIDCCIDAIRALLVTVIFQVCLYFFDLYDLSVINTSFADWFSRIVQAFGIGCIVLAIFYYLIPDVVISTYIFWTSYILICLAIVLWRLLYFRILNRRLFSVPVVILGTGELAMDIAREIEGKKDSGYMVSAFVGTLPPTYNPNNAPVLSDSSELQERCRSHNVERIIVALGDRRGKMPVTDLLQCKLQGVEIDEGITFFEAITGKIMVEKVKPGWLIFSEGFRAGRIRLVIKRIMDFVFSVSGILISLPITLLTALCIKLESPGPIFYRQERVGERGRHFSVIKFRSMRQDAEKHGAVWAMENDPRVTRIGSIIRKTRIDEIPQMWNVLKGEMSFVGPRPERPVFVEQLTEKIPYYSLRHAVKPGITGWAQVCYPYGASEEDALRKLEYDLYYIKNMSVFIDLLIVFRTVKTILFRKGSR
jgi:sugar transferase (PEP-CTERM system associated)